ncbi:hypothetical protein WJX72_007524 [[Myrmecia] bisecta]|uniref:Alpha-ketoglutarate-dependent dioxygenase AlkB-like domain-containing protein n=1 Tax=[Myrmecia] bisecta TaxID=41462 RepID=A0AAW1R846_9CHLO
MNGKLTTSARTTAYFNLSGPESAEANLHDSDAPLDVSKEVDMHAAPGVLLEASQRVSQLVQQLAQRIADRLMPEDRDGWQASYALANLYKDGYENVGLHADRLTNLGPRPIIASLSLGATRTFRIKRTVPAQHAAPAPRAERSISTARHPSQDTPADIADSSNPIAAAGVALHATPLSSDSQASNVSPELRQHSNPEVRKTSAELATGQATQLQQGMPSCDLHDAEITSVDIELRHNTLLVMCPPCQEEWHHSVVRTSKPVPRHPVSGATRINLTFRKLKPDWASRAPQCRCGKPAIMKAAMGKAQRQSSHPRGTAPLLRHRYYYACDSTQGPGCGFWQWCN